MFDNAAHRCSASPERLSGGVREAHVPTHFVYPLPGERGGPRDDSKGAEPPYHTPAIFVSHLEQAPSRISLATIEKPMRLIRVLPQEGQYVFSPLWPTTFPR